MTPRHPAPYPRYVIARLAMWLNAERRGLGRPLRVLDPMAGIGHIHDLPRSLVSETVGVELEPEWAHARPGTIVGDATALPEDWTGMFDAVVVSPYYGNRMSDHHEARDSCPECVGTGSAWVADGCADAPWLCPDCRNIECACGGIGRVMKEHVAVCSACRVRRCKTCGGSGLSRRYTYTHALGRKLSPNNAGQMHWPSSSYLTLHKSAWAEAWRVLRPATKTEPAGIMLCNVKNHLRKVNGELVEQYVTEWHTRTLTDTGFKIGAVDSFTAPGLRHGANRGVRTMNEHIIAGRKIAATP